MKATLKPIYSPRILLAGPRICEEILTHTDPLHATSLLYRDPDLSYYTSHVWVEAGIKAA